MSMKMKFQKKNLSRITVIDFYFFLPLSRVLVVNKHETVYGEMVIQPRSFRSLCR